MNHQDGNGAGSRRNMERIMNQTLMMIFEAATLFGVATFGIAAAALVRAIRREAS
jgi:hypothetical protein